MSPFQQGNPDCHNLNAPKVLLGTNRLFTLNLYCKARLQSSQCFGDEGVPGGLLCEVCLKSFAHHGCTTAELSICNTAIKNNFLPHSFLWQLTLMQYISPQNTICSQKWETVLPEFILFLWLFPLPTLCPPCLTNTRTDSSPFSSPLKGKMRADLGCLQCWRFSAGNSSRGQEQSSSLVTGSQQCSHTTLSGELCITSLTKRSIPSTIYDE